MKANIDQTVREIAIKNPRSVPVFESLGIDYCCGGKRSLLEACQRANVPLDEVLQRLSRVDDQPAESGENWINANISDLLGYIVQKHHGYIRSESPRLVSLLQKMQMRHGVAHSELKSIQQLFATMVEELLMHMMKEENVLFPYLAKMEAAASEGRGVPAAMFGSVEVPISRMLADHDDASELIARIRTLSGDFQPPKEPALPIARSITASKSSSATCTSTFIWKTTSCFREHWRWSAKRALVSGRRSHARQRFIARAAS